MASLKENVLANGFVEMTEEELFSVNGGRESQPHHGPEPIDGGGKDDNKSSPVEKVFSNGIKRAELA